MATVTTGNCKVLHKNKLNFKNMGRERRRKNLLERSDRDLIGLLCQFNKRKYQHH